MGSGGATLAGAGLGLALLFSGPRLGAPRWTGAAILVAALAARPGPGEAVHAGRWVLDAPGRARVEARGGGSPVRLLVEPGAPRTGELVAVLGPADARPWPRGPVRVAGPARGDVERFEGVAFPLPDELVRLAPGPTPGPLARAGAALAALRGGLAARAAAREPAGLQGLLPALLVGERGGLEPGLTDTFTRTGTRHLLALSGLHVGLVAAFLLPATALLGRVAGLRGMALSRAALLCMFAPLAGGAAPVTRAALALALGLAAPALPPGRRGARRPDAASLWGLALSIELLRDPAAVRDLSVQLSYLATAGLLLGTRPLSARLARSPAPAPLGEAGWWWRAPLGRAARALRLAVAASLAAVLATLPVTWPTFGEVAPIGVLSTPLSLPPLALLLGAGWTGVLLPEPLCGPALALAGVAGRGLLALAELVDAAPGTPLVLPPRPAWAILLASAATFAALRGVRGARGLASLSFGVLLLPWTAAPTGLELVALDVGHGTAVAARGPGNEVLLFDAGSRDRRGVGPLAVAPLLRAWEVHRPVIVLSHDDSDHAAALPWLAARFPPCLVAGALTPELEARLPADALHVDPGVGVVDISRRGPIQARLLRGLDAPGNEGSRSLLLTLGGTNALLCGDAEAEGLAALLERGQLPAGVTLLLLPHHGSETPLIGPLLARTRPSEVWVSAGQEPQLARELTRRGLDWRWTARDGPQHLGAPSGR